jgi:hypothetical protein
LELVKRVIELARKNVERGRRPFTYVVVREGDATAESLNLS